MYADMKKIISMIALCCIMLPCVMANVDDNGKALKLRTLKAKKEQIEAKIQKLKEDWNRPRADVSVEELKEMKVRYDSLYLDLRSQQVSIDLEIESLGAE